MEQYHKKVAWGNINLGQDAHHRTDLQCSARHKTNLHSVMLPVVADPPDVTQQLGKNAQSGQIALNFEPMHQFYNPFGNTNF